MPLTNLGTNQINPSEGYVPFTPINLTSGREYLVELRFPNTQGDTLFSSFNVSYLFNTTNTPSSVNLNVYEAIYTPQSQHFRLILPGTLAPTANCILGVQRVPWYRASSNLGIANVQLGLDPGVFITL